MALRIGTGTETLGRIVVKGGSVKIEAASPDREEQVMDLYTFYQKQIAGDDDDGESGPTPSTSPDAVLKRMAERMQGRTWAVMEDDKAAGKEAVGAVVTRNTQSETVTRTRILGKDRTHEGVEKKAARGLTPEAAIEAISWHDGMTMMGKNAPTPSLPEESRPSLSPVEKGALQKYSYFNDGPTQATLRGGTPPAGATYGPTYYTELEKGLDSALGKAKIFKTPVKFARGMNLPAESVQPFINDVMFARDSEGTLTIKGYLSLMPPQQLKELMTGTGLPKSFKGNVTLLISASQGLDMGPYSQLPAEQELLLPKHSRFKAVRVAKRQDGYEVELEQITPTTVLNATPPPMPEPDEDDTEGEESKVSGQLVAFYNKYPARSKRWIDTTADFIEFDTDSGDDEEGDDSETAVENFRKDQPRDAAGRFTAIGRGMVDTVRKLGHGVHVLEQAAKDRVVGAIAKLPHSVQLTLSAGMAAAFASWTAGQHIAEKVSEERGHTPEEARRFRGLLMTLDVTSFKPLTMAMLASGMDHSTAAMLSFVPPATASYLAYSTARHPIATYRAAKRVVREAAVAVGKGARRVLDTGLDLLEDAARLTGNVYEHQAIMVASALESHGFDDWYIALLSAARVQFTTLSEAIEIADSTYRQYTSKAIVLPQGDDLLRVFPYVENAFVSKAQWRKCFAMGDPKWDCHKWAHKTKSYKKLPRKKRVRNMLANIFSLTQNRFCATGQGGGVDPTCGKDDKKPKKGFFARLFGGTAEEPVPVAPASSQKSAPKLREADVTSPEFRAWFGKSKVVDANDNPQKTAEVSVPAGPKPLAVFHGTPRGAFDEFRKDKIARPDDLYYGPGFYFTEDVKAAEVFASTQHQSSAATPAVMKLYLKVEKPFDVDDQKIETSKIPAAHRDTLRAAYVQSHLQDEGRSEALAAGRRFDAGEVSFSYNDLANKYGVSKMVLADVLRSEGYDGLTVRSPVAPGGSAERSRFWVVFEPTQIKSSLNTGHFDPNDPIITHAFCPTGPGGGVDPTCGKGEYGFPKSSTDSAPGSQYYYHATDPKYVESIRQKGIELRGSEGTISLAPHLESVEWWAYAAGHGDNAALLRVSRKKVRTYNSPEDEYDPADETAETATRKPIAAQDLEIWHKGAWKPLKG